MALRTTFPVIHCKFSGFLVHVFSSIFAIHQIEDFVMRGVLFLLCRSCVDNPIIIYGFVPTHGVKTGNVSIGIRPDSDAAPLTCRA